MHKTINRKKDIALVIVMLAAVSFFAYWQAHPLFQAQLIKRMYPIRAKMAQMHVSCSPNSPAWQRELLHYSTKFNNAPANQLAHISPQGEISHCESGYVGTPWFSEKLSPNTRMRYASVSKLWTSDAVLRLVNQGKLPLHARVTDILKEIDSPKDKRWNDITVEHLLLHQGGFDRLSIFSEDMFSTTKEPLCPGQLSQLAELPLSFDPGSKTAYSNLGYCLLGEIVSKVHGRPYVEVINNEYGIEKDGIRFLENRRFDDEVEYNYIETELTGVGDIYTAYNYPALASSAGLSGNAVALARQVKHMLGQPGLNILSRTEGLPCMRKIDAPCFGYAMSPYQAEPQEMTVYFRDGALLGMSSLVTVDDKGGVTVLLSNGRSDDHELSVTKKRELVYQSLIRHYAQ